jgi:hypothetical protein
MPHTEQDQSLVLGFGTLMLRHMGNAVPITPRCYCSTGTHPSLSAPAPLDELIGARVYQERRPDSSDEARSVLRGAFPITMTRTAADTTSMAIDSSGINETETARRCRHCGDGFRG